MNATEKPRRLRIIIVGGSIAGLTLANALDRAGIDFVVLEKRDDISVQTGASLVVFPNGHIILEQLGLYEDLAKATLPLTTNNARTGPKARLIRTGDDFSLTWKR